MAEQEPVLLLERLDRTFVQRVTPQWHKMLTCIQCGTCTASCPNAEFMDYSPRQIWRMVQLGLKEEVLNSRTFWLCSSCYSCTVRCPRGIPLADTIAALKRMAVAEGIKKYKESSRFYQVFMDTVRRYGRVNELELMVLYFLSTNPLMAFGYIPLGWTLLSKGKVSPNLPKMGEGKLDALFRKVEELEGRQ